MSACNDAISLAPCLSPLLSLLYGVSVLAFRSLWNECTPYSMATPIIYGTALFVATVATSLALPCHDDDNNVTYHLPYLISVSLVVNVLSAWLILNIHTMYVQGPKPRVGMNCMRGKIVLITGANAGIGKETARQLLEIGATVIFACRSEKRAKTAMDEIYSSLTKDGEEPVTSNSPLSTGTSKPLKGRMYFLELDLSSLSSVREASKKFNDMDLPLHVLINNAGIMMGERKESEQDGYELTMQCNHLGHFLLSLLLLPKLRQEKDSRVITLTSSTYSLAKKIDLDDLLCQKRKYSLFGQYAQSKLANIMFASELAKREKLRIQKSPKDTFPVSSHVLHPGLVRTDVVRNMPWYMKLGNSLFAVVLAVLQKTPSAGAYTTVYCAASEDLTGITGLYYMNSAPYPLRELAKDEMAAAKLWTISEKLVGLLRTERSY